MCMLFFDALEPLTGPLLCNGEDMKTCYYAALLLVCLTMVVYPASDGYCGYVWEVRRETYGMPGREDGIQQIRNFLDDGYLRSEHDGIVTIMDFPKRTVYHIDPVNKVYRQLDMRTMERADMAGRKRNAVLGRLAGRVAGEVRIETTDEVRTIQGYRCRKVVMHAGMVADGEYWISKDVPYCAEIFAIARQIARAFEENPNLKSANVLSLMLQLDGFPVQSETHAMGGRTVSTLQRISQQNFGKDLFNVPSGYKQVDSLP